MKDAGSGLMYGIFIGVPLMLALYVFGIAVSILEWMVIHSPYLLIPLALAGGLNVLLKRFGKDEEGIPYHHKNRKRNDDTLTVSLGLVFTLEVFLISIFDTSTYSLIKNPTDISFNIVTLFVFIAVTLLVFGHIFDTKKKVIRMLKDYEDHYEKVRSYTDMAPPTVMHQSYPYTKPFTRWHFTRFIIVAGCVFAFSYGLFFLFTDVFFEHLAGSRSNGISYALSCLACLGVSCVLLAPNSSTESRYRCHLQARGLPSIMVLSLLIMIAIHSIDTDYIQTVTRMYVW